MMNECIHYGVECEQPCPCSCEDCEFDDDDQLAESVARAWLFAE